MTHALTSADVALGKSIRPIYNLISYHFAKLRHWSYISKRLGESGLSY